MNDKEHPDIKEARLAAEAWLEEHFPYSESKTKRDARIEGFIAGYQSAKGLI